MKLELTCLTILLLIYAHKLTTSDQNCSLPQLGSTLVLNKRSIRVISRNQANVDSKCSLIFLRCFLATQTSDIETNPGPTQNIPVELVRRRLHGMTRASCVTHAVLGITVIAKD